MNAKKIKEILKKDGGLTLKADGEKAFLNHGFMVSIKRLGMEIKPEDLTNSLVKKYLRLAKSNGGFFGLWIDGNGVLCLDVSIIVEDEQEARFIGHEQEQKAIFDNKGKIEISLK